MTDYLSDVPSDKYFWVSDGSVLKNLNDLVQKLSQIDRDTFIYHVNSAKNDFFNWVHDVIGDIKLANQIASIKNSQKMLKIIENRINNLQKFHQ